MRVDLGACLFGFVSATAGCSQWNEDEQQQSVGARPTREALTSSLEAGVAKRLAVLDDHEGVVEGVVEVLTADGVLLDARAVTKHEPPSRLAELLADGGADQDGYTYMDVSGAQSDESFETRYRYIKRFRPEAEAAHKVVAIQPPAADPVVTPRLKALMEGADQTGEVDVLIQLADRFSTKLKPASAASVASLFTAEQDYTERRASIEARKREADSVQAGVKASLRALGASKVGGLWVTNAVTARVPKSALRKLATIAGLKRIDHDPELPPESTSYWDGADMKASAGLNAGLYHDAGYNGQAYEVAGGRFMRIGMIQTLGYYDHPGFDDNQGGASRASVFDCTVDPCAAGPGATGVVAHDLKCAGIAGLSIRQGQVADYTSLQALERTGVAEEAEVYFLQGANTGESTRAISKAIELGLDALSGSRGDDTAACNGSSAWGEAVAEAQRQNIIVMKSAGNRGQGSGCTMTDPGDAPSVFAVGAIGASCTDSTYSTCSISSSSSEGGYDATVNGSTSSRAVSGVAAVAPAGVYYYASEYDAAPSAPNEKYFRSYTGAPPATTSYAVPQLAGAAALVKDWFLANNYSSIAIEGRPFVVLLAMADRQGQGGKLATGYDPVWGAGRFQMRFFGASDHPGGVMGWESYSVLFSSATASNHELWGSGAEPSGLNQVKVQMMFFEEDRTDIAKIDLRVRDDNCSATSASLGLDSSDDVKKRVRIGSAAAGAKLCARLNAIHMPAGQSRRAHVFAYYSNETSMR
jgi:Subtilase family